MIDIITLLNYCSDNHNICNQQTRQQKQHPKRNTNNSSNNDRSTNTNSKHSTQSQAIERVLLCSQRMHVARLYVIPGFPLKNNDSRVEVRRWPQEAYFETHASRSLIIYFKKQPHFNKSTSRSLVLYKNQFKKLSQQGYYQEVKLNKPTRRHIQEAYLKNRTKTIFL